VFIADQADRARLGSLADAAAGFAEIQLPSDATGLTSVLERMLLIRLAEERIADNVATGLIRCPCHLAIGQEGPPAGVSLSLRPTDRSFGAHRSHGHFLAAGGSLVGLFAEILGRDTGVSRGMGGSMHLTDRAHGFYGSVPIVGATIPIAVGAGLAAKMDGNGDIAVSWFGDGATEEGGFHESMNLARVLNAPVLFVCENNLFSSHLHIDLRQPGDSVLRYADAHRIPAARVDGNDVVEVARVAREAIESMREHGGPFFLECVTYRWRGHVGHREDEDVGVKRKDDLVLWKQKDPIARLARALERVGVIEPGHLDTLRARLQSQVDEAWTTALSAPFPDASELLKRTWSPSTPAR